MADQRWGTAVTQIAPNLIAPRGYPIQQLMGNVPFASAIFLLYTGELPDDATGKLVDAILVSSLDHGSTSPSAMTARLVASGGAEVTVAAAAGLLAIGSHHGGALAPCMEVLEDVVERHQRGATLDDAAREVVAEWRQKGERVPGFGHRVHTADPRVPRLFGLTDDLGKHSIYQDAAWAVERALNDNPEKIIPMNLDGAIAAVLCGLGFPLGLANSLFIVSRFVGLNAQAHEEKTRMRPMRKIQPDAFVWDGAETRNLEESDGDGA